MFPFHKERKRERERHNGKIPEWHIFSILENLSSLLIWLGWDRFELNAWMNEWMNEWVSEQISSGTNLLSGQKFAFLDSVFLSCSFCALRWPPRLSCLVLIINRWILCTTHRHPVFCSLPWKGDDALRQYFSFINICSFSSEFLPFWPTAAFFTLSSKCVWSQKKKFPLILFSTLQNQYPFMST